MKTIKTDILVIGAGPVGLMCSYLGHLSGLSTIAVDKSSGPLEVGRADALNARTLQLMETAGLFDELYPKGKPCNTSSVFKDGKFVSRQSQWWDDLKGCMHKHFLMLGQSFVEQLVDKKLNEVGRSVLRNTTVEDIQVTESGCFSRLSSGEIVESQYVIGSDGARSAVRKQFKIGFEVVKPEITWAVLDGVIESDFPKVPEIIVFQAETSDVAWIPREGEIDRFYVQMESEEFTMEQAIAKINRAMSPYTLSFKEMVWTSKFSVKESVAEQYIAYDRVFLAGDSCHIHSVNGGQGLNTGIADAFNLMWKMARVINDGVDSSLLKTYELERKPVAKSVVDTSAELVRSTKYSETGDHANDYIKIVRKRAGNITGMGIRYGESGLIGERLYDFEIYNEQQKSRLYKLLNYDKFTLLIVNDSESEVTVDVPKNVNFIRVSTNRDIKGLWTDSREYSNQALLIRPDGYIQGVTSVENAQDLVLKM